MIGLPPHQNWGGWVPPTQRTVGAFGTPKGKSGKFLIYILVSSGPRRVHRHQCYTNCWGHSCCKKATVPYLPIRPLQFTGGSPKRVKVENFLYNRVSSGPGRVHRHQCYTTYWGRSLCKKFTVPYLPIRPLNFTGEQKLAHTRVNMGPRHISEIITDRKLKFYTHIDRSKYSFRA